MTIKHFEHGAWWLTIVLLGSFTHHHWNTMIANFEPFSQIICSLLNIYRPWPLQTTSSYLWGYKPKWTHTDESDKDMRFCQGSSVLLEKDTAGALDFGLLPICTGHFLVKWQNINHPPWFGLNAWMTSEILVLLMQQHYYSFSAMICSCDSGQLRCGLSFPDILHKLEKVSVAVLVSKVGAHHSILGLT